MWSVLESFPGLSALPSVWEAALGERLGAFRALCLEESSRMVASIPCPAGCGCLHSILPRHDGASVVAVCRCEPPRCPDIRLSNAEVTPLHVNRARLGRALARALSCQVKILNLNLTQTLQFGWWSCDQVPVVLTIQSDPQEFRGVIAELSARLRRPFILFAPTADHFDAECQQLLAAAQSAFFTIASNLTLTDHGILLATKAPGELFARFTPQPKEADLDAAVRVRALMSKLDDLTMKVFRWYCIAGLSAAQVAPKCGVSKATVIRRLALLRAKTGLEPRGLRTLSPHFERAERELDDSRAAHIQRKRLIYDEEGGDGTEE